MLRRVLVVMALLAAGCGSSTPATGPSRPPVRAIPAPPSSTSRGATPGRSAPGTAGQDVPQFAHIVVVVEENRAYGDVIGSADAPFINALARRGVLLARSYAVTHPSEPNYLALFSGSTHGLTDDSCPHTYTAADLGAQLRARGLSFVGYAESLPSPGYAGCSAGAYARKHAPWTDFADLPAAVGQPMSAFPRNYAQLPRVAFVVPNLDHDMHDGTVGQGDAWLRSNLGGYASWAVRHDSLLVVTWDEDDGSATNHVPGVLVGAHLQGGRLSTPIDHYTVLRTIEAACGLPGLGQAAHRTPITSVWTP